MSKDIPGDVWAAAETALRQANIKAHMLGEPTDPLECISRAILDEREKWTNGSQVQIPVSREQAGLMISVAENYLAAR